MRPLNGAERWRTLLAATATLLVLLAVWMFQGRPGIGPRDIDGGPGAGGETPSDYLDAKKFPDDAGRDGKDVVLASGVTLRPGADGTLPVRPRWVVQLPAPEAIAVDGGTVYAADEFLDAFRLSDGKLLWNTGDPDGISGLHADGGVYIGLDGPDTVRAIAPWNYDISADRRTGKLRHFSFEAAPGADDLRPLPAPAPGYRVDEGLEVMQALSPSGRDAWSIRVEKPWYDPIQPIAIPEGLVLMTSSGLLVVLDHA